MALSFGILRRLRSFMPTSMVGRLALYLLILRLGIYLVQTGLRLAGNTAAAESLGGWAFGLTLVLCVVIAIVLLRWIRREFMWRLRNRLLVTYIFIGVVPLVLVITMVAIGFALFANQYATSQARVELEAEIHTLETITEQMAEKFSREGVARLGNDVDFLSRRQPGSRMDAWEDGTWRPLVAARTADRKQLPSWIKDSFSGIVLEERKVYLRSVRTVEKSGHRYTVATSVPVTKELLDRALANLGRANFYSADLVSTESGNRRGIILSTKKNDRQDVDVQLNRQAIASGGVLPESAGSWDTERSYISPLPFFEWSDGSSTIGLVEVNTRMSAILQRLFSTRGEFAGAALALLIVIAVFFGLIELIALFVGIGITRTITTSVYRLYKATQHINRGDLKHRIAVKSNDQLAALQKSFNSMAESLEELIEEQKEKERLESELAIAQEVQATLFPRESARLSSLELHGICRPARTVSGDYYDFIPIIRDGESEQLVIAVGDISGKGISAALLMATLHSAVRVYEFGGLPSPNGVVSSGTAAVARATHTTEDPDGELLIANRIHSPSEVMRLLNRHLYHSTQPEKYATLFLGVYDGASHALTYSNAGHLPPLIVGEDGSVRRLEVGGLVIGLFDNMVYDEGEVKLRPHDIFVSYSDGITEPENEFGEFGETRLIQIVRENRHLPMERISELVIAAVQDWIGSHEQPDDLTLVLARVRS
jgi:sigma-B regulation protein RsbU (phosphoserine phosphatase)